MNNKIKILAYQDSPTCATGFGTVSRNILEALHKTGKYDITVFGINYWGEPHNFPYKIYPAGFSNDQDPYGRQKFFEMTKTYPYDILFVLQDTFIINFMPHVKKVINQLQKRCRTVCYFPIDGTPKAEWIVNLEAFDRLVAYTEFGKKEVTNIKPKLKMDVIPHGVNTTDFFREEDSIVKDFRKNYFNNAADKFIFMNINRNQQRKDIPRTISAFKELRKTHKDTVLYLHMAKQDQGWNLEEVCNAYGLSTKKDVLLPSNFEPNQGYPRNVVNLLYNAVDCVISTATGEGFGLSFLEAMATGTPVLFPDNTALSEFITSDLGLLAKSGGTPNLEAVLPNDNDIIRPLTDVKDMSNKMSYIIDNYNEALSKAAKALSWVNTYMDWQGPIADKWVKVFEEEVNKLRKSVDAPIYGDVIDTEVL